MKKTNNLFDLKGKVALVTGAARGLGQAMAVGLAQFGANIVVTDIIPAKQTEKKVINLNRKVLSMHLDVTNKKEIHHVVQAALKKFKKIDILVNNAGIFYPTPIDTMKESEWERIYQVNLKGQLLVAQEVGKQMKKQKRGKIINIASIAGILAFESSGAYNVSKAGVIMLTKTLAAEWAKHNIQVNAICPGLFATDMTKNMTANKEFMKTIASKIPAKRTGHPKELAGTVIYLASDASHYVTGHALVIDGGWTTKL